MNILLVPSLVFNYYTDSFIEYPSLGLLSLFTRIKENGFNVDILDLNRMLINKTISFNSRFSDACASLIIAKKPDIVGLQTICDSFHITLLTAKKIKRSLPSATIVLGGPQASATYSEILASYPKIDSICIGESEASFPEFLNSIRNGTALSSVKGISFINKGKIITNKPYPLISNLDELPIPDYGYYKDFVTSNPVPIETGRGCHFNCTFCSECIFWRKKIRSKSIMRVLKEMDHIIEHYDNRYFVFGDDLFNYNRAKINELCAALKDHKKGIQWKCSSRPDLFTRSDIKKMKLAGCHEMAIGVESASPHIQKLIKKRINLKKTDLIIRECAKEKINVVLLLMFGFPHESEEDFKSTIDFILNEAALTNVSLNINFVSLVQGTEMLKKYHKLLSYRHNKIPPSRRAMVPKKLNNMIVDNKDLFSQFYSFYRHNFCKNLDVSLVAKYITDIFYTKKAYPTDVDAAISKIGGSFNLFKLWYKWVKKSGLKPHEYSFALDCNDLSRTTKEFKTFLTSSNLYS